MSTGYPTGSYSRSDRFTGVRISKQLLAVATIVRGPDGRIERDDRGCGFLELDGRDVASTIAFRKDVRAFCNRACITTLFQRAAPAAGKLPGSALGFKIEAVLDLTMGIDVVRVPAITLTVWTRSSGVNVQSLVAATRPQAAKVEEEAFLAAAYVAFAGDPRTMPRKMTPRQFAQWVGPE